VFTSVGGVAATNIARWNGSSWESLNGGVIGGPVRAIAVKDGQVFVGGNFTNAGGIPARKIARWNGQAWDNLGGGIESSITLPQTGLSALKFAGDRLVAGGIFQKMSGVIATNVAQFVDGEWRSVGSGTSNGLYGGDDAGSVRAIEVSDSGEIYFGGTFLNAGTNLARMVVRWTGTEWQPLGGGVGRSSIGSVSSVKCFGNDIYVTGGIVDIEGVFLPAASRGLARWNGTNWFPVEIESNEGTNRLASFGTNLYLSGTLRAQLVWNTSAVGIMKFNGNKWTMESGSGADPQAQFYSIAVSGDKLHVSGRVRFGQSQPLLEWDGEAWNTQGFVDGTMFTDFGIYDLQTVNGKTLATGPFRAAGGEFTNGVAAFDGTNWMSYGAGLPTSGTCLAIRGSEIFAGTLAGVHQWDGSQWNNGLTGEVALSL
jgi:trimeric autotransporter adhesin